MKKVLLCMAVLSLSLRLAAQEVQQTDPTPPVRRSVVVSRYGTDMVEAPVDAPRLRVASPESKVRVAFDIGYSYRTAKAAPGASGAGREFINKMRPGIVYGADIHGFFNSGFGMGARYTGHRYSHSMMGVSDRVSTHYIAPSFMWRGFTRKADMLYWALSLGYLGYDEELTDESEGRRLTISKGGFGSTVDFGYDIRMKGNTFFGFKLTVTSGNINLGRDESGEKMLESLSAIELAVGFRF